MKKIFTLLAILTVAQTDGGVRAMENDEANFVTACRALITEKDGRTDTDRLHQLFDIDWDNRMQRYPEWATYNGYPGQNDRWTDQSREAIESRRREQDVEIEVLTSIDREKLGESDRLSYDLFLRSKLEDKNAREFHGDLMPLNQMGGVQTSTADMLSMMPTESDDDYRNIVSRLGKIPRLIHQNIMLMEHGLDEGLTPPRITLRDVPDQVESQITDDPSRAPLLVAFTGFPDAIDSARRNELRTEAYKIYRDEVVPSLKQLHAFLISKYIPGCRESIGISELTRGKEWYEYLCKHYTTTDLTPTQIHELGLSEVKRIRIEMDSLIASTGFDGDFEAFCEYLRTAPRFYFTEKRDLVREYRDIAKRADAGLVKLFGVLPRLPYGVIVVPEYSEKSQTTAYYEPGSREANRPGYFYVNTYDLKSRPKWEMEALSLHEAVPGHHLQIALAQEMENLPKFRRNSWITAYGEGWALYAEKLGEEMDFYEDPYSRFGQLTYEMWRAIRLVVDAGMHYMGWSRQQAIDYFKQNSSKTEHDITVEVDRYIVWPGQALAYKIGELKIRELRAYAEKQLGDKFDVRAFHDEVLKSGPIPLNILELRIKDWVESQRG